MDSTSASLPDIASMTGVHIIGMNV
jgi:hypothetical protein